MDQLNNQKEKIIPDQKTKFYNKLSIGILGVVIFFLHFIPYHYKSNDIAESSGFFVGHFLFTTLVYFLARFKLKSDFSENKKKIIRGFLIAFCFTFYFFLRRALENVY